jgi:DNA-directed RNA polymerase subunit RPC12/RpoP
MKLESWDELEENEQVFCSSCGKQLLTIDEIAQHLCQSCKASTNHTSEDQTFFCWACGKKLDEMSEVAQGLCHHCKADIIRKIRSPQKINDFLKSTTRNEKR